MYRLASVAAVVLLSLVPLRGQAPTAPTVEQLVAKNVQALGGLERIRAVKTVKQIGRVSSPAVPQGVPLVIYSKRPNLSRQEVVQVNGTLVVAFDGVTAWRIDPRRLQGGAEILRGADADSVRDQAGFDSPLVDYAARGSKIEFVGTESDGGRAFHHVKVTDARGGTTHCYLDVTTGLEARIVTPLAIGVVDQRLADYRDVEGLKMPFSLRSFTDGQLTVEITIESIQVNLPMDDALFKMPARLPASHNRWSIFF